MKQLTTEQKFDLVVNLGKKLGYEIENLDRQGVQSRYDYIMFNYGQERADAALDSTIKGWTNRLNQIQQQAISAAKYALIKIISIPANGRTLRKAILRGEYDQYSLPEIEAVKQCCA